MATITTGSQSGRSLTLTVTEKSQSTANNTTTLSWNLKGSGSASGWVVTASHLVKINGTILFNKSTDFRINTYVGTTIASGEITVSHNSDGNKSVALAVEAGIYQWARNVSASGTMVLTKIPRQTNINSFSVDQVQLNRFRINFSTINTIDYWWYSLNNGSTWISAQSGDRSSSAFVVTSGINPNTTYNVKIRVRRKDSQMTTDSGARSITTQQKALLTSVPNINIGSSHNISFSNQSGATTSLILQQVDGTQITDIGNVSNGVSHTPNANTLHSLTPNSNTLTLRYQLTTTQNSISYTDIKEFKAYVLNSNPIFNNFTYQDTSADAVRVTNNNQIMIKDISIPQFTVSTANRATPQNSATILNYKANFDTLSKTVDYASNDDVTSTFDNGIIKISGDIKMNVVAFDSRDNQTPVTKTINVIDYVLPTLNVDVRRQNNFENTIILRVSGNYSPIVVNGQPKNNITLLQYRFKNSDSASWGLWQNINKVVGENNYISSDVFIDLDNIYSFDIEVKVKDELKEITQNASVNKGVPAFYISDNKSAIGVNCIPPDNAVEGGVYASNFIGINGDLELLINQRTIQREIYSGSVPIPSTATTSFLTTEDITNFDYLYIVRLLNSTLMYSIWDMSNIGSSTLPVGLVWQSRSRTGTEGLNIFMAEIYGTTANRRQITVTGNVYTGIATNGTARYVANYTGAPLVKIIGVKFSN